MKSLTFAAGVIALAVTASAPVRAADYSPWFQLGTGATMVLQGRPCECTLTCDPDPNTGKCENVAVPDGDRHPATYLLTAPALSFTGRLAR